jgi:hypothetical protein
LCAGAVEHVHTESLDATKAVYGTLVRLSLTYSGASNLPPTMIVKLPSPNPAAAEIMRASGGYRTEVRFYQQVGAAIGVRVPACYGAFFDDTTSNFLLLLEDLSQHRSADRAGVPEGRGPSSGVGESLDDPWRSCVRPHARFAEIGRLEGGLAMLTRLMATALIVLTTALGANAQETFRVTLLGTGNPQLRPDRFGPGTLVEAGDQKLLFDAGRGVPIRLAQIRVPPARLDALFITHYHSDHVNGIPDLWLTAWLPGGGGRTKPFRVIGPTGAKELMANLERAYAADVRIRIADQKLPAL